MLTESSIEIQQRILKAVEKMPYQLTRQIDGIRTEINNVKDIFLQGAAAENKKQPHLTHIEDLLAMKVPGFKKVYQEGP